MDKKLRKWVARLLPARFPGLYSTLDDPMRVPVQEAAYQLTTQKYLISGDCVLDVGLGLGYGLEMMSRKGERLIGIDIDRRAVAQAQKLVHKVPGIEEIRRYDGKSIPYLPNTFDLVTCIDVIEHVPDYMGLITEIIRVSRRAVVLSTPNRRLEYTRPDGSPMNRWHLREWVYDELDVILRQIPDIQIEWNFLDGPWDGPFEFRSIPGPYTMALTPALLLK